MYVVLAKEGEITEGRDGSVYERNRFIQKKSVGKQLEEV